MGNFLGPDDHDDGGIAFDEAKGTVTFTGKTHERARVLQLKENARRKAAGRNPMTIDETLAFMRNANAI